MKAFKKAIDWLQPSTELEFMNSNEGYWLQIWLTTCYEELICEVTYLHSVLLLLFLNLMKVIERYHLTWFFFKFLTTKKFGFLKNFWWTHVHLWGHWYPRFGLLVTSPLAFKAKVGSLTTEKFCMKFDIQLKFMKQTDNTLYLWQHLSWYFNVWKVNERLNGKMEIKTITSRIMKK